MKRTIIILSSLILLLMSDAYACTGIYIGPDVSADGSILIARFNDYQANRANHLEVTERVENQPGRMHYSSEKLSQRMYRCVFSSTVCPINMV